MRAICPPACLLALLVVASPSLGQEAPDTSAYVLRIGRDTSHAQVIIRDGSSVNVHAVRRIPSVREVRTRMTLHADGTILRMEETAWEPFAGENVVPVARSATHVQGDSTIVEVETSAGARRFAFEGRAHVANALDLVGVLPLIAASAPPTPGDSIVSRQFAFTLGIRPLVIRRESADRVSFGSSLMGTIRARLDDDGRVVAIDGTGSSINYTGERVPALSIDSVTRVFAERERRDGAVGSTSPRDSVITSIADGSVMVNYGRPSRRGREIFGGIVPWDRVWRTGANQATHLHTDRTLRFGDTEVLPGSYTLWTLPSQTGWTLIVNAQTGQWGTDYDSSHDLVRVPMSVRTLSDPVEQFTILIEPQSGGGVLRLRWDRMEASTPFRAP